MSNSTPVWHDIFRKVTLKPDNITLEAERFDDTLNIVRGPGVSWGADSTTDTFSILVDYNLTIPAATTKIALEDINGNLSEIEFSAGRGVGINRISAHELQIESFSVTETDTLHSVTSRNNITTNAIYVDNLQVGTIASDTSEDGFLSFDAGHNLIGDGILSNPLRFSPLYQDSTDANKTDQFEFTASGPGTLAYAANYVADTAISTGSVTLEREDPANPGNWSVLDTQSGSTAGTAYFIDGIYNEAYSGTVTYRLTYSWTGNTGEVTWYTNNTFEAGQYSPIDNPLIKTDSNNKTVDINDIQFFQNTVRTLTSNTDVVFDLSGTGQVRVLGNVTADTFNGNLSGNVTGNVTGNVLGDLTGNVTGNVSGNAGTVTNGVYTTGSYFDPSWITGLDASKIIGSINLSDITIDGNIRIFDNVIETTVSNSDLELRASGTGQVRIFDDLFVQGNITINGNFVNGTQLRTSTTSSDTLSLSAYDVDGTAYTNLITLTAGNNPQLTITSTATGTINNMSIGATTRAAGNFTTLDANSTVGLSPANANVTVSPTGTGTVTMNPATAGTINNMSIGATTRAAGNFTTLDANNAVGLSPANQNVTISPTGTGTVTINPATAGTINNMSIGATVRAAGNFTNLDANGNVTLGSDSADIITVNGTLANNTIFRAGINASDSFSFAGYDTNTGPQWRNLITITSGIAPTVTIDSNGVGTIDNMTIGATTRAAGNFTTIDANGNVTLGSDDNDTITANGLFPTGTQLKSDKSNGNTLNISAYDVDGAAYSNLITLTASNTPSLTLSSIGAMSISSTAAGNINNMNIGASTPGTGSFTTLTATGLTTLQEITEVSNPLTGSTGVVTHDFNNGLVWFHSSIAANFTANFTNVPTTDNRVINFTLWLLQGGTPFFPNAVQINGVGQTIRWANGATPVPTGNVLEAATFTLIRSGATWYVVGQLSSFN